jgi:hypothetical protein
MILEAIADDYFKIVSEGLRAAGSFIKILRPVPGRKLSPGFSDHINTIYAAVMKRLKATDIDQEVSNYLTNISG